MGHGNRMETTTRQYLDAVIRLLNRPRQQLLEFLVS